MTEILEGNSLALYRRLESGARDPIADVMVAAGTPSVSLAAPSGARSIPPDNCGLKIFSKPSA